MTTAQLTQPLIRVHDAWRHQCEAYHFATPRTASMLAMGMGCVDGDTEYLTPTGWKRIADYKKGDLVAQVDAFAQRASFVNPLSFVNFPCNEMLKFKTARGIDMLLSYEHRVLWYDHRCLPRCSAASEFALSPKHKRILGAFTLDHPASVGLSDEQLRLMVAVCADGSFPKQSKKTLRVQMRLKKVRKKDRLVELLNAANTPYRRRNEKSGFSQFSFVAPERRKTLNYWEASEQQRQIICDEVVHWDGSQKKSGGISFFSRDEASADFVQYCFVSTGRRASKGDQHRKDGSIDYVVSSVGKGRSGNLMHPRFIGTERPADGKKYCFRVPFTYWVARRNGCVFLTGNTGKSKVTIDYAANLGIDRTLILCPVSVMGVWRREFDRHWLKCAAIDPVDVLVLDNGNTSHQKARDVDRFFRLSRSKTQAVVVNYESAWRGELGQALLKAGFRLAVGDELHRIKAPGGKASKWCQKLGLVVPKRLGLSGTPMPHSPLDLYGQFRFLDPSVFGTSFAQFRARYAITDRKFPSLVRQWINQDDLNERFHDNAYVCSADDVLDLPEVVHETRICKLEPKTQRVYDDLEKNFISEVEAGTVTVANALVKLLRLQQCTSGFVSGRDDADEQFTQELGDEKARLLADLLEDIDQPVVVFCRFWHDLDVVERVAKGLKRPYGELSGRRRDAITGHAEMSPDVEVAGVQIQSGGVGIDLTRSCYGVYFSLGYSLGDYDQSVARLHRPGQTRCVRFYHLIAEHTVDRLVYKALDERREVVQLILHDLRGAA